MCPRNMHGDVHIVKTRDTMFVAVLNFIPGTRTTTRYDCNDSPDVVQYFGYVFLLLLRLHEIGATFDR